MDNKPGVNGELRELALFAGAGGGILGGLLCGFRTVCAVEIDAYCRAVLCQRQNEGILAPFPIWDDVRTFDGKEWRGLVDVISAGFPCTDISTANPKGKGLDGENSGLWSEARRIIGEIRPRFVLVENSPNIVNKGGVRVVGDLTELGYDCTWGIVSAADAGAPHLRKRWWCLAYTVPTGERGKPQQGETERDVIPYAHGLRQQQPQGGERDVRGRAGDGGEDVADAHSAGRALVAAREGNAGDAELGGGGTVTVPDADLSAPARQREHGGEVHTEPKPKRFNGGGGGEWWAAEPDVGRVAYGVANRVHRLKALGNGQVPAVVKLFWETVTGGEE